MSETKYELRTLKSKDVFPMVNIISCIGINEFKNCFKSDDIKAMIASMKDGKEGVVVDDVGIAVMFDIANVIISNITAAEQHIYQFLANLSGMNKKEIEELDMVTFFEMIVDVIKKDEFRDFLKVVSKLL